MKERLFLALILAFACSTLVGCSSVGPRKYVFFGEPQPEKVEMFEDYWEDYPFRPDDPSLPLRRGKGGVIRFFKKNSYIKSILVDGELTVNVYYSQREGITLTQPDSQMILTSEELNEKHRKFNKETGYSYHIYLDLGEYDQPIEEITILSVFRDAKTGQATLSKEIRTTTLGTSPPVKKQEELEEEDDAEKIARRLLGSDEKIENPIAELQARYAVRNKKNEDELEANGDTRAKQMIDVSNTLFEDLNKLSPTKNVSYLEQVQKDRNEAQRRILEENYAKEEYYREKRAKEAEKYRADLANRNQGISSLRDAPGLGAPANFNNVQTSYIDLQKVTSQNYESIANQLSERANEEYAGGAINSPPKSSPTPVDATAVDGAKRRYADERMMRDQIYGLPLDNGYELPKPSYMPESAYTKPSELDALDDFIPDDNAPSTEVYLKKM